MSETKPSQQTVRERMAGMVMTFALGAMDLASCKRDPHFLHRSHDAFGAAHLPWVDRPGRYTPPAELVATRAAWDRSHPRARTQDLVAMLQGGGPRHKKMAKAYGKLVHDAQRLDRNDVTGRYALIGQAAELGKALYITTVADAMVYRLNKPVKEKLFEVADKLAAGLDAEQRLERNDGRRPAVHAAVLDIFRDGYVEALGMLVEEWAPGNPYARMRVQGIRDLSSTRVPTHARRMGTQELEQRTAESVPVLADGTPDVHRAILGLARRDAILAVAGTVFPEASRLPDPRMNEVVLLAAQRVGHQRREAARRDVVLAERVQMGWGLGRVPAQVHPGTSTVLDSHFKPRAAHEPGRPFDGPRMAG